MRILLSSYVFYPSLGGIESFSMLMAERLAAQGHEVTIITESPNDAADSYPFKVIRQPSQYQKFAAVLWCDVFFHSNITLSNIWPLLFLRRPWIVTHQTWINDTDGTVRGRDILKRVILRAAQSVSISRAIADSITTPSIVIPNSYDDSVFSVTNPASQRKGIAFVGRLVSDKGVDLLIEACVALNKKGYDLERITIIGEGPELGALERQAKHGGLSNIISFPGKITGQNLSQELNSHLILVVPSRWNEPFGIVALEGLATGCVVVGSKGGGLIDAIGPCGPTFENNVAHELEVALERLISQPESLSNHYNSIVNHLRGFKPSYVFKKYLQLFTDRFEDKKLVLDQRH